MEFCFLSKIIKDYKVKGISDKGDCKKLVFGSDKCSVKTNSNVQCEGKGIGLRQDKKGLFYFL